MYGDWVGNVYSNFLYDTPPSQILDDLSFLKSNLQFLSPELSETERFFFGSPTCRDLDFQNSLWA